jgi:hypothetical protein
MLLSSKIPKSQGQDAMSEKKLADRIRGLVPGERNG